MANDETESRRSETYASLDLNFGTTKMTSEEIVTCYKQESPSSETSIRGRLWDEGDFSMCWWVALKNRLFRLETPLLYEI